MDIAYFPYGEKSKEFLIKRAMYLIAFLFSVKKVDKIILACNTLSYVALPFLKILFPTKVMGVNNLFNLEAKDTLLIGSAKTCEVLRNQIACYNGHELIRKIECGEDVTEDIRIFCQTLPQNIKTVYLGCTHFIRVKKIFREYIAVQSQDELLLKEQNFFNSSI